MKFLELTISEWASLMAIVTIVVGVISWFVKLTIVNPLKTEMKELNTNIKRLSHDISNLQSDNKNIYNLIDLLEKEVTSKSVLFEQQIKTLFERLKIVESKF